MSYKMVVHRKAHKELQRLPAVVKRQVEKMIDSLGENPRPFGYKKLTDYQSERSSKKACYRLRQWTYRIIYTVEDDVITVTVIQIQHCSEVYKK